MKRARTAPFAALTERRSSISGKKWQRKQMLMEVPKHKGVVFERGQPATIMAIDGTWGKPCTLLDVSDSGTTLSINSPLEGLRMSEFFLVLSTVGKAYRRCQLAWVNGNQLGVEFLKRGRKKDSRADG